LHLPSSNILFLNFLHGARKPLAKNNLPSGHQPHLFLVSHPNAGLVSYRLQLRNLHSFIDTMYTRKLALLAVILGATVAYAYPAASKNPESLALVAARPVPRTIEDPRTSTLRLKVDQKRQIHNADYHANGPPSSPNPGSAQDSPSPSPANPPDAAPSEPAKRAEKSIEHGVAMKTRAIPCPRTNTADRDTHAQNMPCTIEYPDATSLRVEADQRRQIHNADYHTNGPPPSPNPAAAQDDPSPSPPNSPDAAPSEPAAKDKRAETPIEHGPGPVVPSPSRSDEKASKDGGRVEESSVTIKKRSVDDRAVGGNGVNHRVNPIARVADGEWYGLRDKI
ncbi:hypothetical protein B0H13DRAFT_1018774, partial [Mycena leptocephala]